MLCGVGSIGTVFESAELCFGLCTVRTGTVLQQLYKWAFPGVLKAYNPVQFKVVSPLQDLDAADL